MNYTNPQMLPPFRQVCPKQFAHYISTQLPMYQVLCRIFFSCGHSLRARRVPRRQTRTNFAYSLRKPVIERKLIPKLTRHTSGTVMKMCANVLGFSYSFLTSLNQPVTTLFVWPVTTVSVQTPLEKCYINSRYYNDGVAYKDYIDKKE